MAGTRVLIVEDSPTDAKLVVRELQKSGRDIHWEQVQTEPAMRAALANAEWDLVISDWSMPEFSALRALAVLQSTGRDLPFIVVSGTVGEESAVEAMRNGASDYVLKDHLTRLNPAVERELRDAAARREHKRAADALHRSETRFARLTESGVIAVCIGDTGGRVTEANDAFLAMTGFTREDLEAGRVNLAERTPPEWADTDRDALESLEGSGVARPREKELIRKDGDRVPVMIGVAMLDKQSTISILTDLTSLRRTEEALRRTEEQLRHAQKMEALGSLAGGIAHDFNNLLSVILSYTTMLSNDLPATDPALDILDEIRIAGERAAALTRQLLTFSRHQLVRSDPVDLNEVVAGSNNMLRRLIGEDIELIVVAAPTLPLILADGGHLEQVIMNLAVNARDAMPHGGKLIIETAAVDLDAAYAESHIGVAPGDYVMLAMSDTGIGMDRATQARMFEPFFTTKGVGQGTGLGLSTVFGIVQQSGGTIWAESALGRGTTFRIYFPVPDIDREQVPEPLKEPEVTTLEGTETILLVEDEEAVRSLASLILRRHGYTVLEASGGGDALLICEQHTERIHLLLTDVVLPRMSGRQVVERLRHIRPDLKVLYMSGYTSNAVIRHGVIGADVAFLQKPFTPTTLAHAVRQALESPGRLRAN